MLLALASGEEICLAIHSEINKKHENLFIKERFRHSHAHPYAHTATESSFVNPKNVPLVHNLFIPLPCNFVWAGLVTILREKAPE